MRKPVAILHFQPLEMYPPVMNFVDFIGSAYKDCPVLILSTRAKGKNIHPFQAPNDNIKIIRLGRSGGAMSAALRYCNYLYFYAGAFFYLLARKPAAILYYETLSAFPAYLYKKFVSPLIPLFIHYHEYTSVSEYATGMKLVRYFHTKEKSLYPVAKWISHTNSVRLAMFTNDEGLELQQNTYVLPNYPSSSWLRKPHGSGQQPFRVVYAGALSMDTMYTEAFARWVQKQNGEISWDIYSNNMDEGARLFFGALNSPFIRLLQSVEYSALKDVLPAYDAGVILYNGHLPNYVHNAPNKLFEYMACGLDVWFPQVMAGCLPYVTRDTFPKVMALNFATLEEYSVQSLANKQALAYQPSEYFYENVYPPLAGALAACRLDKSKKR